MFNTPMRIAMLRAAGGAVLTFAVALVSFLQVADDATMRDAILAAAGPALGYIVARGVAEGWYDGASATQRAADRAKAAGV